MDADEQTNDPKPRYWPLSPNENSKYQGNDTVRKRPAPARKPEGEGIDMRKMPATVK